MFEQFDADARRAVVLAQEEARQLGCQHIGTESLLLGCAQVPGPATEGLAACGLTADALRALVERVLPRSVEPLDGEALALLGIDLTEVRRAAEEAFGPGALDRAGRGRAPQGHIPFTKRSKKTLELGLREAVRRGDRHIDSGHVLLGILREGEGLAMKAITLGGVGVDDLRLEVERRIGRPAA